MSSKITFHVLIVEDDFRVAQINQAFVEVIENFSVMSVVKTGAETKAFLQSNQRVPDVILLDIYIPDVTGLELLWYIRSNYPEIQVIMITAANETATIQEALQAGIFDYIMKPVKKERVENTFQRLREETQLLLDQEALSQEELDELRFGKKVQYETVITNDEDLPKGIDPFTLKNICQALQESGDQGLTASVAAKSTGTSRSTSRRYLEYLISVNEVRVQMIYGDVGRPERRYFI
ncbi:response regulator [Salipaludibacillus keqinensis]|uniref:Response regulator n=1 Tax=Salipaludibacillus keqinensis TaxID=2045207 RepID=A0A323TTB9_9BACI|nr:response regulator [Salipaludibacillus keqinensis]PYZ92695.1 response regulator [Salipaludibacillus keqinensis]